MEEKDVTNFGSSGWKEITGGLFSSALMGEGQWEAGDAGKVDDEMFTNLGAAGAYTACPDTADVGDLAWVLQALKANYKLGGAVGDVAPWTSSAAGKWPLVRGKVGHPPGTARTATGSGTAVELTAVSASQYIYGALHVLSVSGTSTPTITVKIQSDVDNTFGSPADQITFTAATAIGGQISRTIGAITDTWWRAQWTITGTDPSFLFVVSFGVQ